MYFRKVTLNKCWNGLFHSHLATPLLHLNIWRSKQADGGVLRAMSFSAEYKLAWMLRLDKH